MQPNKNKEKNYTEAFNILKKHYEYEGGVVFDISTIAISESIINDRIKSFVSKNKEFLKKHNYSIKDSNKNFTKKEYLNLFAIIKEKSVSKEFKMQSKYISNNKLLKYNISKTFDSIITWLDNRNEALHGFVSDKNTHKGFTQKVKKTAKDGFLLVLKTRKISTIKLK